MAEVLMACFDVYANPGNHADTTPYLLNVQNDLFEELDSRVVMPLRREELFEGVRLPERLTPVFTVEAIKVVLETPKMGAVSARILKRPVASLASAQNRITAALDFLFQGY